MQFSAFRACNSSRQKIISGREFLARKYFSFLSLFNYIYSTYGAKIKFVCPNKKTNVFNRHFCCSQTSVLFTVTMPFNQRGRCSHLSRPRKKPKTKTVLDEDSNLNSIVSTNNNIDNLEHDNMSKSSNASNIANKHEQDNISSTTNNRASMFNHNNSDEPSIASLTTTNTATSTVSSQTSNDNVTVASQTTMDTSDSNALHGPDNYWFLNDVNGNNEDSDWRKARSLRHYYINKVIDTIFEFDKFERQVVILRGLLSSPRLSKHWSTINMAPNSTDNFKTQCFDQLAKMASASNNKPGQQGDKSADTK